MGISPIRNVKNYIPGSIIFTSGLDQGQNCLYLRKYLVESLEKVGEAWGQGELGKRNERTLELFCVVKRQHLGMKNGRRTRQDSLGVFSNLDVWVHFFGPSIFQPSLPNPQMHLGSRMYVNEHVNLSEDVCVCKPMCV